MHFKYDAALIAGINIFALIFVPLTSLSAGVLKLCFPQSGDFEVVYAHSPAADDCPTSDYSSTGDVHLLKETLVRETCL